MKQKSFYEFDYVNGRQFLNINSYINQPITNGEIYTLVLWQGKLIKSKNESHQPKLYILIKEVNIIGTQAKLINQVYLIQVPSNTSHEFSIGSLFKVNKSTFNKIGLLKTEEVNLTYKNAKNNRQYLTPLDVIHRDFIHEALNQLDASLKNKLIYDSLIKIHCDKHHTIYIPTMVFFTAYFGSSDYLHHLLLTRPLNQILEFITDKIDDTTTEEQLFIKTDKYITGTDTLFISSLFMTPRNYSDICHTIQSIQNHDPEQPLAFKPLVYFNDLTSISAQAIPISKTEYLITQISGSSIPKPDKQTSVVKYENVPGQHTENNSDDQQNLQKPRPTSNSDLDKLPLDADAVPGHNSPDIVKHSARTKYFETVSFINKFSIFTPATSQTSNLSPNLNSSAAGNKFSANSNVGRILEHFGELAGQSTPQPTIYEMYRACLHIKSQNKLIQGVNVFNPESQSFVESPEELTFVSFDQISETDETDPVKMNKINNWIKTGKNNRGFCIIRINTNHSSFYLLEIERKINFKKETERGSYMVFTFQISNGKLEVILPYLIMQLTKTKGRLKVFHGKGVSNFRAFPHRTSKQDKIKFISLINKIIRHHS